MGNNSTSPGTSPANNSTTTSSNGSYTGDQSPFGTYSGGTSIFASLFSMMNMEEVVNYCHVNTFPAVSLGIKIFTVVTGFPANAGLMWLLLSSKKALSASEVLGLNLSILDILFCLCLPLDIYAALHQVPEEAHSVGSALSALNISGCPLLLTFMCFERYLAAARPVAYMRLGKWEYRAALCACAWVLTLVVALLAYFWGLFSMALYLALSTSVLFLLMLLCLGGIVWVLCQSGPGEGSGTNVPLKRRALKNILAVMVPSVVAYAPLVALVPFMAVIEYQQEQEPSAAQCKTLQVLLSFPHFGLLIGPLFYLSRARQLACWKKEDKRLEQTPNSQTQAE